MTQASKDRNEFYRGLAFRRDSSKVFNVENGELSSMTRLYPWFVWMLGLAFIFSLATGWKVRQELEEVRTSNESLRKILSDLTVAIAGKEKEIDRLEQSRCVSQ